MVCTGVHRTGQDIEAHLVQGAPGMIRSVGIWFNISVSWLLYLGAGATCGCCVPYSVDPLTRIGFFNVFIAIAIVAWLLWLPGHGIADKTYQYTAVSLS